ncbi:MAG: hypothetical protein N3B21_00805 [Clostridia bacterium]|nr:hypothetical protein [Clostridia bacterium]
MIIQAPFLGLALAGRLFTLKNTSRPLTYKKRASPKPRPKPMHTKRKKAAAPNPLQNLIKGLTSSLSRITKATKKTPSEDYEAVIKSFVPLNATVLTPKYPLHTGRYQFADLDGDLHDELITSYKLDNKITTLILKKQNERWDKVGAIENSKYDTIDFMRFADITGEAKKQLLLGGKTKAGVSELAGYSLHNRAASELFTRKCSRLELLESATGKTHLAVWDAKAGDEYDVEVVHWNGSKLEPVLKQAPYYYSRVLPYYAQKARTMPQNPSNWYNFADVLFKTGMHRDGIAAIEVGLCLRPDSALEEKFLTLREKSLK